ncbi:SIMPL domain-containing protein [Metabacillus litoralis]|uniref:SIMPL domain-containing protein n=1 Tax=Metabacillus litoralis TaxID=152268 RepID=UPI001CFDD4EF|nr:SIMPL domain-containing protein [Metabacillus litoralis]
MAYHQSPYYFRSTPISRENHGKLTVEGTGMVTAMPNKASITLGVMTENQNVEEAQNQNAVITNNVITALKNSGLTNEQIQTISYTILPIYRNIEEQSILTGYKINHILEIDLFDLDKIGEVYEIAISNGANIAEGLRFSLINEEYHYQQALNKAMKQATLKAISLGHQIGVTFNPIPSKVTENSSSQLSREIMFSYAAESPFQTTPPIQKREISIQAKLTAVFYY